MNSLSNNERYYISNSLDGIDILTENIESNALLVDGSNFMMADLDAGGHNVKNVATAVALDDAVPLGQLNTTLGNYVDLTTNQTIGGTKTFSNQVIFNGATKTNLVATDIPNAGNRIWMLNDAGTSQTIAGSKNWSNSATFNGPNLNTTGTNVNINSTNLNVSATTITNLNNGANCNNKNLTNVANPVNAQDGATKNYIDNAITGLNINNYLLKSGGTMTGNLNMNSNYINNVATPTVGTDASNKSYVDTIDTNIRNDIYSSLLLKVNKAGDTMTGNLNMNTTNKIINVLNPSNPQDVSTKNYTDTADNLKVNKAGDTMTGDLTINAVLNLNAGTANDPNVDPANETNTYIRFGEAGTASDFAYLRQIGGINDIQLALDLHDNGTDGQFHIRSVGSINTPDAIKPFFTSGLMGTIINYPDSATNTNRQLALRVNDNGNDGIFFHTNLSPGSYNSLVDTNDKAIIFSDGTTNTGKLVIGNWGDYGMKLDCENGEMTLNSNQIINKNTSNSNTSFTSSSITLDLTSGTIYDYYNLTYSGLSPSITIIVQSTTGGTNLLGKSLNISFPVNKTIVLTTTIGEIINLNGVNYTTTTTDILSSCSLICNTTLKGYYTTGTYTTTTTGDQLILKSNTSTNTNSEYTSLKFVNTNVDGGIIRVETDRSHTNSTMRFYTRNSGSTTLPLELGTTITANKSVLISETTGTTASATQGSLTLEHQNSGGASSIVFKSKVNSGSDYGYIQYKDSTGGTGTEKSQLTIGVENDETTTNEDNINFKLNGYERMKISGTGVLSLNGATLPHLCLTSALYNNTNTTIPTWSTVINYSSITIRQKVMLFVFPSGSGRFYANITGGSGSDSGSITIKLIDSYSGTDVVLTETTISFGRNSNITKTWSNIIDDMNYPDGFAWSPFIIGGNSTIRFQVTVIRNTDDTFTAQWSDCYCFLIPF